MYFPDEKFFTILAAVSLPRSQRVEFPGLGHDLIGSGDDCVGEIVDAFPADPLARIDRGCIETMPRTDYLP